MPNSRPAPRADRPGPGGPRILLDRPMAMTVDWTRWLRSIERKRRLLARAVTTQARRLVYREATRSSFLLEGIDLSDADLDDALAAQKRTRAFRSRQRQRVRNHLAILTCIERSLRRRDPLRPHQVVRWYTSISSGLSTQSLDSPGMDRIDDIVRRINSPQMRLQPALQEIARLHVDLLSEAMFPSFNGILARLLLQVHLGHCGLPFVALDPLQDPPRLGDANHLLPRLLELIDQSLDRLVKA